MRPSRPRSYVSAKRPGIGQTEQDAELETMRAELDARRTLVEELARRSRARAGARGKPRRKAPSHHGARGIDQSARAHDRRAQALRRTHGSGSVQSLSAMASGTTTLPGLTEADVHAMEQLEKVVESGKTTRRSRSTCAVRCSRRAAQRKRAVKGSPHPRFAAPRLVGATLAQLTHHATAPPCAGGFARVRVVKASNM